ncbi:MAG: ABC transporter ATP-binding protein [Aggregatilineales bacterium]
MSNMIEARGLRKVYQRPDGKDIQAVKGVDLTIRKGEIFSLLGPNGAGKTTTISMISGLVTPTEGDAMIGGFSIQKQPMQAKKLMGVIPQEIALYENLSARQNLEFFGKMYSLSGKDLARRVDEVLDFIDLTDRQKDKVKTFSGGMKRRVNIGVGLLHQPQLIHMDEPTVGIDPQNRRRILDTVFRLRDEYQMTVLYTTHLMEEAQELSDRVGIIDHGEIIALGTQGQLTQEVGEEDRLILEVSNTQIDESVLAQLKAIEGVSDAIYNDNSADNTQSSTITIKSKRGRRLLPRLLNVIEEADIEIQSVEVREPDLEAVFLHLTGRALRD